MNFSSDDIVRGPDWDTQMEGRPGCKVRDLLTELYDKAGHAKQWWLVRHTAGMLRKKVEDLAKAATDIIVRQKQLAVGLPPEPREKIITRLASSCHFGICILNPLKFFILRRCD